MGDDRPPLCSIAFRPGFRSRGRGGELHYHRRARGSGHSFQLCLCSTSARSEQPPDACGVADHNYDLLLPRLHIACCGLGFESDGDSAGSLAPGHRIVYRAEAPSSSALAYCRHQCRPRRLSSGRAAPARWRGLGPQWPALRGLPELRAAFLVSLTSAPPPGPCSPLQASCSGPRFSSSRRSCLHVFQGRISRAKSGTCPSMSLPSA